MSLIEENQHPFIVGGYNDNEFDYMIEYLISLGNNVKIIYPETLKNGYLMELNKIIENYAK